jgi:adenylate cyclase
LKAAYGVPGNTVRINAQLIDGANGEHLWAEIYDGDLTDIFALQDNITSQIVAALAGELKSGYQTVAGHSETDSTEAYDNFLRGWEYYQNDNEKDLIKVLPYFERAVVLDPNYSRAYAAIAATIHKAISENWRIGIDPYNMRTLREQNLERAMIEPTPLSHVVAASVDIRQGKFKSAIEHGERALELNSSDIGAHLVLGRALIFSGKHREALPVLEKAMRLDPVNPAETLSLTGLAQFMLEDTSAAVITLEQARALQPEIKSAGPTASLMSAYAHLGRSSDAQRMGEDINPIWFNRFLGNPNLTSVMTLYPFKKRRDTEWFASGLLRAGVCCELELANILRTKQE